MRLMSFHPDVRQLLNTIAATEGPFMGDPRFVATVGTAICEWLEGRIPTELLHYDLDNAIGECTANRGDKIFVCPNHVENLAAADAIDADVAGISIIGLGNGKARPTFTYTNAAGEFVIGADNITLKNLIFNASVTTVLKGIDVEAGAEDVLIEDCLFGVDADATDEFNSCITIGDQANNYIIRNCQFHQGTGAAVQAIHLDADVDYGRIEGCFTSGDYGVACIKGDEADDMVMILRNILYNGRATGLELNDQPCIEIYASTTGVIAHNFCATNLTTMAAAIVADDCHLFENYYNENESGSGTGALIGTASADDT